MKGFRSMQEVLDKLPVEVEKAHKQLDLSHIPGCQPLLDAWDFDWVYFYMTIQKDEAEIFNCWLSEYTLFSFEVDMVFPEDVEDL